METASLLGLDGAQWFCDFYLRERDKGVCRIIIDKASGAPNSYRHARTVAWRHIRFAAQGRGYVQKRDEAPRARYRAISTCDTTSSHALTRARALFRADAFYWAPPGGESIASACLRVDRVLDILRYSSTKCFDHLTVLIPSYS